ncbi:Hsp33 family molecular chaperone HslO [Moraxella haemolytica]|uniref:Hsp33 family molecular chaperone HslO n=1 Tax=Moraxella haemolytica TaxID=2904119 RepID=UPI0025429AC1|nr:Hsp33 family molecular chaperone HslO [Moraxella sp. ZY171148]WII95182.1 Hsp33 family molecular chaperone HslO [Moraxella sp. ZY171148]
MTDIQTPNSANQYRQRFFIERSPVRGDVVRLTEAYQTIITKKNYPTAVKALLGEMLVAASLLIGTLKINGRLSVQLQSSDETSLLSWAMAECDHTGCVRALAGFKENQAWQNINTSRQAFGQLGQGVVLFISIHPERGEAYQGIVERVSDDLAECLAHYQKQSAQIPTLLKLATSDEVAGGILVQLLPQTDEDRENDPDLWERMSALTGTIKTDELTELQADEILYRLYHEEEVVTPEANPLSFGCTCSAQKSEGAILQLGHEEALNALDAHGGVLALDCGFCGQSYQFDEAKINALFI